MTDMEKYPYFIYPAVKALRSSDTDEETAARLRRLVAANVGDVAALRLMLGIDPEEFARFYPDLTPPSLSTTDTINSFLIRFGNAEAPTPQAAAEIPAAPAEYVFEENAVHAEAEEEPALESAPAEPDATASLIDSFLSLHPDRQAPAMQAESHAPEHHESRFSETKANHLIKKHDYQGALEIIQQLILNNPEKSIYFADQIRFLRKLILNEALKNNINGCASATTK